jgi:hypothetical protein
MSFHEFLDDLGARIDEKCQYFGPKGCFMWFGTVRGGKGTPYGRIRVKFPTDLESKYYYVHRLKFQVENKMQNMPNDMHVSHLCHFSLCCKPDHLSLEPQMVNNQRLSCSDRCIGHDFNGRHYPDCLI